MQNFIPINVVVGDRTYRIKINEDDENKVLGIAGQLNNQLTNFKAKYAGKDMQDYLAMVVLWYISEQSSQSSANVSSEPDSFFMDLERKLDSALGL